jgi:hypothetical protein
MHRSRPAKLGSYKLTARAVEIVRAHDQVTVSAVPSVTAGLAKLWDKTITPALQRVRDQGEMP